MKLILEIEDMDIQKTLKAISDNQERSSDSSYPMDVMVSVENSREGETKRVTSRHELFDYIRTQVTSETHKIRIIQG